MIAVNLASIKSQKTTGAGGGIITGFATGIDDNCPIDLLDSAGPGSLDCAILSSQGNLVVQTGFFTAGHSSNSGSSLDATIYIDADSIRALVALIRSRYQPEILPTSH